MSWRPAVFVGFNSIRFDEEMLRHALFQCLYPVYLTSTFDDPMMSGKFAPPLSPTAEPMSFPQAAVRGDQAPAY